ncbi:MAG: hypothetical protein KGN36_19385 [Acidobacteriota bacterium]|nr:hypothetical protein [Acidobacteriota bacterium]
MNRTLGILLVWAAAAWGQPPQPSCSMVAGWSQRGEARSYEAENLFEYMDGNAEGYLIYGFKSMRGVTCVKDGVTLVIDISDMGDADSAFGIFSANRDSRQPGAAIGMGGQIVPRRAIFAKGSFYAEIAANPEGDYTALLKQWTGELDRILTGTTAPPAALNWFPAEKRQTIRLVPESVLGIRLLTRGYAAQYEFGKAFVVVEAGGDSAAAVMKKLRARYTDTSDANVADEAFQAKDQYLGRLCFFRKGKYLGGYANVAEGQDPVALAQALASALR